jgi:hypothetical protein
MEKCIDQKIDAVLIKKWHLIIGIVGLVTPAIIFFANINSDLRFIKYQNEQIAKSIEKIQDKNDDQDIKIFSQQNKITQICTVLKISDNQ